MEEVHLSKKLIVSMCHLYKHVAANTVCIHKYRLKLYHAKTRPYLKCHSETTTSSLNQRPEIWTENCSVVRRWNLFNSFWKSQTQHPVWWRGEETSVLLSAHRSNNLLLWGYREGCIVANLQHRVHAPIQKRFSREVLAHLNKSVWTHTLRPPACSPDLCPF